MKDSFIQKLNQRASINLSFKEVMANDEIFTETIDYLKKQKFLNFDEIFKIIKINSYSNLPIGNVLIYKENIVGFMGTLYSKKTNNIQVLTCNIHSWIVDKKFRINSFYLLSSILSKDVIFTAFTPVKSLIGLLNKFNFTKKTYYYKTLVNLKFFNISKKNFFTATNDNEISDKLSKNELLILKKYNKKIYYKLLFYNNSNHIFVVGTKLKKKGLNIFNIFYVSNTKFFKENWNELKYFLSKETKCQIFSEFLFHPSESFFPKNLMISRMSKKEYYIRSSINIDREDLLDSDLVF